jgi:Ran GTPase-activating protein (RanGAP) involved in mRNA processing and transport
MRLQIGPEGGKWFALLLQVDGLLSCLDLRCNRLGDAGLASLAAALPGNRRLQKLVLYDNGAQHAGCAALFAALHRNTALESLDLSANDLGAVPTMESLKALLIHNRALRNLFLWGTQLTNEGAIALAEGLAENKTALRLELRNNVITAAGLLALSHALRVNKTLFKLMVDIPEYASDRAKEEYALSLCVFLCLSLSVCVCVCVCVCVFRLCFD